MGFYTKNSSFIGKPSVVKEGVFDMVEAQLLGDALYPFTTFTFTNAGVTGRAGPTLAQCQTAYAGAAFLSGYFNVTTQGFQEWTVPASGLYQFVVRGANGVPSTGASAGAEGGQGIIQTFQYTLIKGDVLKIVVGQSGTASSIHGGGGGATAVLASPYNTTDSIIAIAGGGGGRRQASTGVGIPGASYTTYTGYGTRNGSNSTAAVASITSNSVTSTLWTPNASTLGYGGGAAASGYGDGGAGFFGNGFDDTTVSTVAQALTGTAVGGFSAAAADGGFGGGADGAGGNGGGGGGGYTGGSGGHSAGGGGSYINVAATSYSESFDGSVTKIGTDVNLYHGYVTITKI